MILMNPHVLAPASQSGQTPPAGSASYAGRSGDPATGCRPLPLPVGNPSRTSWAPTLIYAATWALLLAVTCLWALNGGIQQLVGTAPAAAFGSTSGDSLALVSTSMESLGRLTGLIASILLLIQVTMMARIPWIEQALGQDRLTYFHRILGFSSFSLMLAHIGVLVLAKSSSTVSVFSTAWMITTTYPGMVMAVVGTVALILVVATSFAAARRSMRYETWHLIHLYAYFGAGLAVPHQLWTGSDLMFSPVASAFWIGAWLLAAGSVVVFRILLPLALSLYFSLRVHDVTYLQPDLVQVTLVGKHMQRMPARGGQYFVWRFCNKNFFAGLPVSLSAAPNGSTLQFTCQIVGPKTQHVSQLTPGTKVFFEGPYGRFHGGSRNAGITANSQAIPSPIVILAAGTGVLPALSMVEAHLHERRDEPGAYATVPVPVVIVRAPNWERLPQAHRFHELNQSGAIHLVTAFGHRAPQSIFPPSQQHPTARRSSRHPERHSEHRSRKAIASHDAQTLSSLAPHIPHSDIYLCGPTDWMNSARYVVRLTGAPADTIHAERFGI